MYTKSNTTEEWPVGFKPEPGLPVKVSLLRWKLGNKAKQEPRFRFYALYDRIYRKDVLEAAYALVRKKAGSPGCDGISFEAIEAVEGGVPRLLETLRNELQLKTYTPRDVCRVYIPKPNGKVRPLGIPCIRDRVVQRAVLLILEPIFEQAFQDCSYGFRPGRSARQAVSEVRKNIREGRTQIYDADLSSYFDTIDHDKLMKLLEQRLADRSVLRLIRLWLKACIIDEDDQGQITRTKPSCGTPQGGVISPLLANVYLNYVDKAFYTDPASPLFFANARLIRYADDFVIMAQYLGRRIVKWIEEQIEGRLALHINRDKTRTVDINDLGANLNFLGFTFRKDKDLHGRDHRYLNIFPSDKAVASIREKIRALVHRSHRLTLTELIDSLNDVCQGWKNSFNYGYPRQVFRGVNYFVQNSLRHSLRSRSQRRSKPLRRGETIYAGLKRYGFRFL